MHIKPQLVAYIDVKKTGRILKEKKKGKKNRIDKSGVYKVLLYVHVCVV